MFTKRPEPRSDRVVIGAETARSTPVPSPTIGNYSTAWPSSSVSGDKMNPSVIGSDLIIMGNLESKGEVTIEGQVQGDIHCAMLLVGEHAQVTGGIVAEEVVVRGRVMGSVRGNKVTLQASAHVEGDVYHKALAIEQGAFFEGKSRRSDDPMAVSGRNEIRSNGVAGLPMSDAGHTTN